MIQYDSKDMYGLNAFRLKKEAIGPPRSPFDGSKAGLTGLDIIEKLAAPTQVQWTVSRKCNFECPHCFNNSGPHYNGYEPCRDVIIENIRHARPFNVCLCGGEPFFWNDLPDIVRKLRDGGIPSVGLVTNGYLVTPERLKAAVDAGLTMIQVSIDGADAHDHSISRPAPNSWDKAREALRECARYDVLKPVAVAFIPNRVNLRRFRDFVSVAVENGAGSIRVQPLMSSGRAATSFDFLRPTASQYLWLKLVIRELYLRHRKEGIEVEWGDPLEHIGFYANGLTAPQHLSLQTNGWYELSPYLPVLFADSTRIGIRDFWTMTHGLKDLWQIPVVQKMAAQLTAIDHMGSIRPRPYLEDFLYIDRLDEANWRLATTTDDVDVLLDYARTHGPECDRKSN